MSEIKWPFGDADVQSPAYATPLAVTITDQMTILKPAAMSGALTINLTISAEVKIGAKLVLRALSDGTARTVTFGTGFQSGTMAGVISKTKAIEFTYDGTYFIPSSNGIQID